MLVPVVFFIIIYIAMNYCVLDLILFGITLIFCLRGAIRGFIDEIFGIGTFFISLYIAFRFNSIVPQYLPDNLHPLLMKVLSFLVIFICAFLILKIIQLIIKGLFSAKILKSLDHALGFFFGFVESIFLIAVIFFVILLIGKYIDVQPLLKDSLLFELFQRFLAGGISQLPEINVNV